MLPIKEIFTVFPGESVNRTSRVNILQFFFSSLQSDKLPSDATLGPVTEVIIFFAKNSKDNVFRFCFVVWVFGS